MGPLFFIKEGLVINNKLLTMGIYLSFSLEHRSRHVITQSSAHVRRHVSAAALRDRIYAARLLYPSFVHPFVALLHSFVSDSFIWFRGSLSVFFFQREVCVVAMAASFWKDKPRKDFKTWSFWFVFTGLYLCSSMCPYVLRLQNSSKKQLTSTHRLLQYPKCWRLHFFFREKAQ